ncbi:MAG: phytanoyl-CoA dioxygenase family protein [Hyphomonadaceae bacterium]|nr:phytanoyl-CoA dioxygenase family protein [Hyphomonadaceae bacterium]
MRTDVSNLAASATPSCVEICSAAFWREFAPDLHVGGGLSLGVASEEPAFALLERRMQRDGYFECKDKRLERLGPAIGNAVEKCVEVGLPAVFVWAFDEPWESFRIIAPTISHFLGADYKLLPAFWAWHVDPKKRESGWRPHRDNSRGGLAANGAPLTLTCWIPLSEANPQNSCMYVVPAHLDPQYGRPMTPHSQLPDLSLARALPAQPGDYLVWNQAVLHWGSASSEFADRPRMSIALEFQRGDIPPIRGPLLNADTLPPFEMRIRLIARQILQYTHMYKWSPDLLRLAEELRAAPIDPA